MAHRSRILDGGCSWFTLPEVEADLDALKASDSYTYAKLEGLKQDASSQGMVRAIWKDKLDYRAPLERNPERIVAPPWLGELKTTGRRRRDRAGLDWRLYFSEPIERDGLVVVCGLGWKDPVESTAKGSQRQAVAIRKAMGLFKRYCATNDLTYPPFEPK